jgi:hypothetical protein
MFRSLFALVGMRKSRVAKLRTLNQHWQARPRLEEFESRTLLNSSPVRLHHGDLLIKGTHGDDTVTVTEQVSTTGQQQVLVDFNGQNFTFDAAQVNDIRFKGRGGSDIFLNETSIPDKVSGIPQQKHGDEHEHEDTIFTASLSSASGASGQALYDATRNVFQVRVTGAMPNTTYTVAIDVKGDGTDVVTVGTLTTGADGAAELDLLHPANFPTLSSSSIVQLTATGADTIQGTFALQTETEGNFSADLTGITGASGKARFKGEDSRFVLHVNGLAANTTYMVSINSTGTGTPVQIGTITTDADGDARLRLKTDSTFPTIQSGSVITITDASGNVVLQGTFSSTGDEGGGDHEGHHHHHHHDDD